jgi:hypothetical protein
MSRSDYVEVQLAKCLVVLTKDEFQKLLQKDPNLWEQALKRGKAIRRVLSTEGRPGKMPAKCRGEKIPL